MLVEGYVTGVVSNLDAIVGIVFNSEAYRFSPDREVAFSCCNLVVITDLEMHNANRVLWQGDSRKARGEALSVRYAPSGPYAGHRIHKAPLKPTKEGRTGDYPIPPCFFSRIDIQQKARRGAGYFMDMI
jgi:hypothetical protein